jgi:cytochrome c oxidase subunit 2
VSDPIHQPERGDERAARTERNWALLSSGIVAVLIAMAAYAGVHQATMPQVAVETVDPSRLHLSGEFIESNLGSTVQDDGSVLVRAIGQQYSFTPQCVLVPADTKVTLRMTSADVVHGFIIDGTTVNTMLIPGYVSTLVTRFAQPGDRHMPCHEFCGVGHEGMWGNVKIIDKAAFQRMAADKRRLDCAE